MGVEIKDMLLASAFTHNIAAICYIQDDDTCGISPVADTAVETIKQEIAKLCIELCMQYPECYNKELGEYILCVSNKGCRDSVDIVYDHNGCIRLSGADPISRCVRTLMLDAPAFEFDLKKTDIGERRSLAEMQARRKEIDGRIYRELNGMLTMPNYLRDYILYIIRDTTDIPKIDVEYRIASQLTKLRKMRSRINDFKKIVSTDDARVRIIAEYINSHEFKQRLAEFDEKLRNLDMQSESRNEIRNILNLGGSIAVVYEAIIQKDIAAKCPVNYTDTKAFVESISELMYWTGHTIDYFLAYDNGIKTEQNLNYLIYNTCVESNLTQLRKVLKSYHITELIPKDGFTEQLMTASQSQADKLAESVRLITKNNAMYDAVKYSIQDCIISERLRDIGKLTRDDAVFISQNTDYYSNIEPEILRDTKRCVRFNLEEDSSVRTLLQDYIVPSEQRKKLKSTWFQNPNIEEVIRSIAENREYITKKALNDTGTLTAFAEGALKDIEFNISMLETIQSHLLDSDDQILLRYLADTKVIGKRELKARIAELTEE